MNENKKTLIRGKLALVLPFCMTLLSGCWHSSLTELRHASPGDSVFNGILAEKYLEISEKEAGQHDWFDADHFAKKGVNASKGEKVIPDEPEEWDIPPAMLSSLIEARRQLSKSVTEYHKKHTPELAAEAYVSYDCWLEELEESGKESHIASCRDRFFESINLLSVAGDKDNERSGNETKANEDDSL